MRDDQLRALEQVLGCYTRFSSCSAEVFKKVHHAQLSRDPLPAAALQADFDAQIALSRAVLAYVETCGESPDVDGLAGAAYVLAIHQSGSQPKLRHELAAMQTAWPTWIEAVRQWDPDGKVDLPPRPQSNCHANVLDVVASYQEFLGDKARDRLLDILKEAGFSVTDTLIQSSPDGKYVERTRISALPRPHGDPEQGAASPACVGEYRRELDRPGMVGRRWRVVWRDRRGEEAVVSQHWRCSSAIAAGHRARVDRGLDQWVEVLERTTAGWRVREVLPSVPSTQCANNGGEVVLDVKDASSFPVVDVGPVGVVYPMGSGWAALVSDGSTLVSPSFKDYWHATRAEACEAVCRLWRQRSAQHTVGPGDPGPSD